MNNTKEKTFEDYVKDLTETQVKNLKPMLNNKSLWKLQEDKTLKCFINDDLFKTYNLENNKSNGLSLRSKLSQAKIQEVLPYFKKRDTKDVAFISVKSEEKLNYLINYVNNYDNSKKENK